ncbi:MAG: helix-turn-helix transcriptional regulator, partial [Selenomonadaceae bacterium]|nr:helix-turn-helix transcriptional regulator [Selenomonadaceae bacterium]
MSKKAREEAGLTIKELADLLGAPYRTIQNWNLGERKPPEWIER